MTRFFPVIRFGLLILFFFGFTSVGSAAPSAQFPEVMVILDASGSMWGRVGSDVKMDVAKQVLHQVIPSLPSEVRIGLTAYGHRVKGDCRDIEILIPAGSDDRTGFLKLTDKLQPKGKTPIAGSIKLVVEQLRQKENETTIILVSDGEETCHPDPCGVVKALKASGIKFILHVVGFDVNQQQKQQLACLAQAGGGQYFSAGNGDELLAALNIVQQEVVKKVEFEKAKTTEKKATSKLGKLRISFPPGGEKSLAHIKIIRKKDDKVIKTAEKPAADSTHPLLAGDYMVFLGYANSNYQKPSELGPIPITVNGGETAELRLGTLIFNVADSLKDIPADEVILENKEQGMELKTVANGNNYYFFTSKPLPPGTYTFKYFYKTYPEPVIAAEHITINENQETVLTLDSGIKLKKHDQAMTGYDLIADGATAPVLQVRRRWDNDYPLWAAFAVSPGTYSIMVYLKGMDEPLPVAEGVVIEKGQLLEFDTGL